MQHSKNPDKITKRKKNIQNNRVNVSILYIRYIYKYINIYKYSENGVLLATRINVRRFKTIRMKHIFSHYVIMAKSKSKKGKKGGRKWSMKYKKSINCQNPKGFSQKQYCKYGRKTQKKKSS